MGYILTKLLAKNASEAQSFSQESSRKSLYLNFVFSSFSLNFFSREELSRELLTKMPLKKFLKNNTKMHFEQKLKTRKYKNTFKNI